MHRTLAFGALAFLASLLTPAARADEGTPEQAFLYLVDPHGPGARHVLAAYGLAFSSGPGAIRPVPGNLDARGLVHDVSIDVGLHRRVTAFATGLLAQPLDGSDRTTAGAVKLGTRVLLTPIGSHLRVAVEAAWLHEFGSANGLYAEVTGSYDLGRVRLAAAVHVEHVFAAGRDPVDLYAVAGASVRVAGPLRLGAEYVAQDLEAAFEDDEAEGGLRNYLGPNLALALDRGHVLVTAGVAAELAATPGLLARGAVGFAY